jgi:hypothetical protein
MPAEARVSSIWKKQKLFVALFLIAIGGWFFWDGLIGYPRSNEHFMAHQQLQKEGRLAEWPAVAKSKGWDTKVAEHYMGPDKIIGQYVFGTLAALAGGVVLLYWLTQKGRVLKTDDAAVYTPAGTRVPFEAVTGIGKKKWDSKGLATVRYELGGKKGKFVVDDYKFDAEPTRAILGEIETRLLARAGSASEVAG